MRTMQSRSRFLSATCLKRLTVASLGLLAVGPLPTGAHAQEIGAELRQVQQEQDRLNQRIQELELRAQEMRRQLEAQAEKAAEVEAPRVSPDRDPIRLEIGGRINQVVLFADNGSDEQAYIADNDNSGSRFSFRGEGDFRDITSGVYLEVGFEVNTTDEISFGDDGPVGDTAGEDDFLAVRHAEWYLQSERWGELWVGYGNTATEEVAEVDLSGTGCCIAESDVDDIAGGLEFETGQEVDSLFNNLDGDRTSRIAYITPSYGGASLGVSVRQENERLIPEAAIYYAAEIQDYALEAAAGWRREDEVVGDAGADVWVGSVSVLAPMGVNATLASGIRTIEEEDGRHRPSGR